MAHTPYPVLHGCDLTATLLGKWLLFSAIVAAVATTFIELVHLVKRRSTALVPRLPLRMALGGVAVVVLWCLVGTSEWGAKHDSVRTADHGFGNVSTSAHATVGNDVDIHARFIKVTHARCACIGNCCGLRVTNSKDSSSG